DVRRRGDQPPGRRAPPQDQAEQQRRHQPPARRRRHRRQRAPPVREIAGGSLLPAHRREARVMIATIKSEWRKNRFRPAFLVASGIMAAITVLVYSVNWYLALHPLATRGGDRAIVNIATLYPDQFVNNVMGAAFPIGAAMAIVVGALFAGSEYGWGTMKTMFTQGPGRLTVWAGRLVVFGAWMLILTLVLFAVGAISSVVVASFQGHAISGPAAFDLVVGIVAIRLFLMVTGTI